MRGPVGFLPVAVVAAMVPWTWMVAQPAAGAPASASVAKCLGQTVTISGTAGNDVINGTAGADVINALAGDDEVYGMDGDDVICLGPGDDFVDAGNGNDTMH